MSLSSSYLHISRLHLINRLSIILHALGLTPGDGHENSKYYSLRSSIAYEYSSHSQSIQNVSGSLLSLLLRNKLYLLPSQSIAKFQMSNAIITDDFFKTFITLVLPALFSVYAVHRLRIERESIQQDGAQRSNSHLSNARPQPTVLNTQNDDAPDSATTDETYNQARLAIKRGKQPLAIDPEWTNRAYESYYAHNPRSDFRHAHQTPHSGHDDGRISISAAPFAQELEIQPTPAELAWGEPYSPSADVDYDRSINPESRVFGQDENLPEWYDPLGDATLHPRAQSRRWATEIGRFGRRREAGLGHGRREPEAHPEREMFGLRHDHSNFEVGCVAGPSDGDRNGFQIANDCGRFRDADTKNGPIFPSPQQANTQAVPSTQPILVDNAVDQNGRYYYPSAPITAPVYPYYGYDQGNAVNTQPAPPQRNPSWLNPEAASFPQASNYSGQPAPYGPSHGFDPYVGYAVPTVYRRTLFPRTLPQYNDIWEIFEEEGDASDGIWESTDDDLYDDVLYDIPPKYQAPIHHSVKRPIRQQSFPKRAINKGKRWSHNPTPSRRPRKYLHHIRQEYPQYCGTVHGQRRFSNPDTGNTATYNPQSNRFEYSILERSPNTSGSNSPRAHADQRPILTFDTHGSFVEAGPSGTHGEDTPVAYPYIVPDSYLRDYH